MQAEVIAAIIALVGVILSAIISFVVARQTTRFNYKHLFAETVSQSRNKWLNDMREYVSQLLSNARRIFYKNVTNENVVEICNEYDECKFQILMRLNLEEKYHRKLHFLILALEDLIGTNQKANVTEDDFKLIELEIINTSRSIFKEEWEKVKREAKGE
mgnify:CR=1 FL=1